MKNMLLKIQEVQKQIMSALDKKDPTKLSQAAGENYDAHITFAEHEQIAANYAAFKNDWSRFKEDSTKIVIEKNLLIHMLRNLHGYFLFRKLNKKNRFIIPVDPIFKIRANRTIGTEEHAAIFIVIFLIFGMLGALFANAHLWLALCSDITLGVISIILNEVGYRRQRKFQDKMATAFSPEELFKGLVTSVSPVSGHQPTDKLACTLSINATPELNLPSEVDAWYQYAFTDANVIAMRTDGQVGWLWNYKQKNLKIVDEVTFTTGIPTLAIKNYANCLLPVVETNSSFIFCLPNINGVEFLETHTENEGKVNGIFAMVGARLLLTASALGSSEE